MQALLRSDEMVRVRNRTSTMSRRIAICILVFMLFSAFSGTTAFPTRNRDSTNQPTKLQGKLVNKTESNEQLDVLVQYDTDASRYKAAQAIKAVDSHAEIVEAFEDLGLLRVKLVGSSLRHLSRNKLITKIWSNEPQNLTARFDFSSIPSSSEYSSPVNLTGAHELWEEGYNGSGVVIAVLDTGVNFLHPDLDDFDDNGTTQDSKVTAYASFVEGDSLPIDLIGHGTYAASVCAGTGNASDGLYAGIAPGATLISAKVTLGGLLASPSWIVSGIEWAVSRGADIILMPFNTFGSPGDAVDLALQEAAEMGLLVVAAAGDDGPDYLTVMSPGGSQVALTVGAYDTENQEVPTFSGRGPSFGLFAKPDLVAPGMGIVGARADAAASAAGFGSLDTAELGGVSSLLGGDFGEEVDENYIRADSTAASASIVAGAAAILLQAFDRATPIAMANVLRDTATELEYGVNDAGAGLLNLPAAFDYLSTKEQPGQAENRTTGLPLLATGLLSASAQDASTTLLMSSFGTSVVAIDSRGESQSSIHQLMGMLWLRWNDNDPMRLMEFKVKREMHQVATESDQSNYNRWIGILSYNDTVYVALMVEAYNFTLQTTEPIVGFRFTPHVLNLGQEPIENVSLFMSYSLDLFSDGRDDHGKYDLLRDEIFAYAISEDHRDYYFGLNASRKLSAFEVGNSSDIDSHVSNDNLTGSTQFDGSVGLGMKWNFGRLSFNDPKNVTIAMGFAENRTFLDESIDRMWTEEPPALQSGQGDLVVVEASIPRTTQVGLTYESSAVVMNIGFEPSEMVAAMVILEGENETGTVFSKYFSYSEVDPFTAKSLSTEWNPEKEGMRSAAWVVSVGLEYALALVTNPSGQISSTAVSLLDDFLIRDVFVETPIQSTSVFPKHLPSSPFNIRFPSDFSLCTVSLTSTVPLGNVTVAGYGNASDWGDPSLPESENVKGYYNFSLFSLAPPIMMDGYHRCDYVVEAETGWSQNTTLETLIHYPKAMMLYDTSHGGGFSLGGGLGGGLGGTSDLDMGDGMSFPLAQESNETEDDGEAISIGGLDNLGSIDELMAQFRMTTFSGLSEMDEKMAEQGLDLIETPGMELDANLLTQFAAVIIAAPSEGFNSTEISILRNFTGDGGKLIILGDHEDRNNITGLNSLLEPYGYSLTGKHTQENTTEIVHSSPLSPNIESIYLEEGAFIENNHSMAAATVGGRPVVLLDSTSPELVLFGSSRLFMNKNLEKNNNSILLDNLNEYLLKDTLNGVATLSENQTSYPTGKSVYLNLYITDHQGRPVNDLTVAVAFELPNGSLAYFIAGFVGDGLYSSQFTPNYWRSDGRINAIFIILGEEYATTYASVSFTLYEESVTPPVPDGEGLLTMPQFALLVSTGTFGVVGIFLAANRMRRRRRMRIPEVDPELTRRIDTALNTLLAVFRQMEEIIQREDLDRIEKIESLRGLKDSLEEAEELFEEVNDMVGGV